MNFEASRAKALDKLNYFVENNLSEYSKLRNFDYGPDNRSNISCLSPYITHGIINEKEVIKKSLNKFSFAKNEKFIQEVLWRTYWKGWLELRPNVWTDFLIELKRNFNKLTVPLLQQLPIYTDKSYLPPIERIRNFLKDLTTLFRYAEGPCVIIAQTGNLPCVLK